MAKLPPRLAAGLVRAVGWGLEGLRRGRVLAPRASATAAPPVATDAKPDPGSRPGG